MPVKDVDLTKLVVFDTALLNNKHQNDFGVYIAALSETGEWRGGDVYVSYDQSFYEFIASPSQSVGGYSTEALATAPVTVEDTINTLKVRFTSGTPTSVSEFLPGVNFIVVGNELIQFRTATLINGSNYEITNMRRGLQGTSTEDHLIYEDSFIVDQFTTLFIQLSAEVVNETIYFKLVPPGFDISEITDIEINFVAKSVKPLPPTEFSFVRADNDDITFSWNRSTRANTYQLSGDLAPVYEEKFQFVLDLASSTRVETVNDTDSFIYTAAQQTSDGLTPGDPVSATLRQVGTWVQSDSVSITAT